MPKIELRTSTVTGVRPAASRALDSIPVVEIGIVSGCRAQAGARIVEVDDVDAVLIEDDVARIGAAVFDAGGMQRRVAGADRSLHANHVVGGAVAELPECVGDAG